MKNVTITFPKIPCSVDLTLFNAPLYFIRRVTHRRAVEQTAGSFAKAMLFCDDDPKGFAGVLAEVLTITTGSPADRIRLMHCVLLAVRAAHGHAYWEKVVEALDGRKEQLSCFDEHSAVRAHLTLVEKDHG